MGCSPISNERAIKICDAYAAHREHIEKDAEKYARIRADQADNALRFLNPDDTHREAEMAAVRERVAADQAKDAKGKDLVCWAAVVRASSLVKKYREDALGTAAPRF